MAKTAFLFPGQGSQKVGMGSDLLEARPEVFDRYLNQAEEASGLPIRKLCLEGPIEELTSTDAAQPALFATSLAVLEVAREEGLRADFVAGHSLGEYTAAVASGALSFDGRHPARVAARAADGGIAGRATGRDGGDHRADRGARRRAVLGGLRRRAWWHPPTSTRPSRSSARARRTACIKLMELAEQAEADKVVRLQVGRGLPQRADGADAEADGGGDGRA